MKQPILLSALLLVGCAEGPPTRGVPTTFAAVCDKANEGKRMALEGYVDFPEHFKGKDLTIMMRLRPEFDSRDRVVGVSARLGKGPNHIEKPPVSYTVRDIRLNTTDGKVLGYRDKVMVSGTMYYPLVAQEFKCGLTNTLIESPGQ